MSIFPELDGRKAFYFEAIGRLSGWCLVVIIP